MNRDIRNTITNLSEHLAEVDKALDVLSSNQAMAFSFMLLTQRLNDSLITKYQHVQDRSSFLYGAQEVLNILTDIPDAIRGALAGSSETLNKVQG